MHRVRQELSLHACDACEENQEAAAFDQDVLNNASWYGRRRVCRSCFARGFTPRDVESYPCLECGDKGHLQFERKTLEKYKARGRPGTLVCTACTARYHAIEKTLANKRSLRCTCKGKPKDIIHDYSNDKCALHPTHAGEQLWPGKNLGVSLDEFHFVKRMRQK